jgi:acetyltransferase-like isoleucine patch superfamily enzyme
MIGGGTIMCGVNHGWESLDRPMRHQPPTVAPIVLEDDVWIGMGVLVLPGVRIGRGSIIAAGAIVTRDIPPGSVAAGQPARVTRRRAEAGS